MDGGCRKRLPCALWPWCRWSCVQRTVNEFRTTSGKKPLGGRELMMEYRQLTKLDLPTSKPAHFWTMDGTTLNWDFVEDIPIHPDLWVRTAWCEAMLATLDAACTRSCC